MNEKDFDIFASSLSHDLKNPLRTIVGFCNILYQDLHNKLDEEHNKYLQTIQEASSNLSSMIDDILLYYKSNFEISNKTVINLQDIIKSVVLLLDTQIKNRNIQFDININQNIIGSKTQLTRLFLNLFNNSIQYSDTNKQIIITVSQINHENYHIISIKDNGFGIDKKYIPYILKDDYIPLEDMKFTKKQLGFSICNRIMKQHNGYIELKSIPNIGTEVLLYFPK